jgi:general stress protein 26
VVGMLCAMWHRMKTKTAQRKPTATKGTGSSGTTAKKARSAPRTRKRSKALSDLAGVMRGIDLCMMTSHRADGSLHTRPMSNNGEVDFDGDAWFFTSRETPKVDELEADARVGLSYVGGSKRAPVWIAVSGVAEIVDDAEKKKSLWLKELDRWFEDGPEDPGVVLIHVRGEHATWWRGEDHGEVELG